MVAVVVAMVVVVFIKLIFKGFNNIVLYLF